MLRREAKVLLLSLVLGGMVCGAADLAGLLDRTVVYSQYTLHETRMGLGVLLWALPYGVVLSLRVGRRLRRLCDT